MARRPDHRRGHRQELGERLQRLQQLEGQGETTSVDTPAGHVAARGRRQLHVGSLTYGDRHTMHTVLSLSLLPYYLLTVRCVAHGGGWLGTP